MTRHDDLQN